MADADYPNRAAIAQSLSMRCNNCYTKLPGEVGCSVHSPGWNWITPNFGPFCNDCAKELHGAEPFRLDEVVKMFQNIGFDTSCGACMEVAFTGATTNQHTHRQSPEWASTLQEARQLKAFIDDLVDVGGEERKGPYSGQAKWDNVKRRASRLADRIAAFRG